MASVMKEFEATSNLYGANASYVEEQYEGYLADPASVDPSWRAVFDAWQQGGKGKDVAHTPVIEAFQRLAGTLQWHHVADQGRHRKRQRVLDRKPAPLHRGFFAEVPGQGGPTPSSAKYLCSSRESATRRTAPSQGEAVGVLSRRT